MTKIPKSLETRLTNDTDWLCLPPLASKILELGENSRNELGAVADAIGSDPITAEKILNIANSNIYARRRQSANLRQAMIVLGLSATFTLALGLSLVSKLREARLNDLNSDTYWRRALLAGICGKLLAVEFGRRDAEEVFLAALLQDIGMLAIDGLAEHTYEALASTDSHHSILTDIEQRALQTDHRVVGAWLLEHWGMPEKIVAAVKHSHELSATDLGPEQRGFCRTVTLSGQISDIFLSHTDEATLKQVGRLAHRHFGILPNRLVDLLDTVRQQVQVCEAIFDMEIFVPKRLQAVTDAAKEILGIPNLHLWQGADDSSTARSYTDRGVFDFSADQDPTTGIFSRRSFDSLLRREFDAAQTHGWPLSLVAVDIDRISDVGGASTRDAPDDLLGSVVDLLINNVRATDYIALAPGGGFMLLLPGRTKAETESVAERLLTAADGQTIATTLSLGIATHDIDNYFPLAKDLVAAADEALYNSQRSGRNRGTTYADIKAA